MDALKRFSLALMAAVVVAGATPAFSQTRDTRPEQPDRPTTEPQRPSTGGDSQGDADSEVSDGPIVERSLPASPPGFQCLIDTDGTSVAYAYVVNNTGKTIPHGTMITWYVQPGNIVKHYKVEIDWLPGHSIWIPDSSNALKTLPAFCSISLQAPREDPNLPKPEAAQDGPTILTKRQLRERSNRPIGLHCEMQFIFGEWVPVVTYNGPKGLVGGPQTLTVEIQPSGVTNISQIHGEWTPGEENALLWWPDADEDPYIEPPTCTAVAK